MTICTSLAFRIAKAQGEAMTPRKKREKVVAEITTIHLMKFMQEQGRSLDQQGSIALVQEVNGLLLCFTLRRRSRSNPGPIAIVWGNRPRLHFENRCGIAVDQG